MTEDRSSSVRDNMCPLEAARVYLSIIEALAYTIPETGIPLIVPVLADKMGQLLQKLAVQQTNYNAFMQNMNGGPAAGSIGQSRSNFERVLAFWFSALLRMVVIHRSAFSSSSLAPKGSSMSDQVRLLVSIFCIALSRLPNSLMRIFPMADYFPHPQAAQSKGFRPCPGILLHTHALDVAISLIDALPDEIRHKCARFLKDKCPSFLNFQNDPRFAYLLGPMTDTVTTVNNTTPSTSLPSPAASGSTPVATPTLNPPSAGSPAQQSSMTPLPGGAAESGASRMIGRLQIQHRNRTVGPYPLRPWELLEDAAPRVGENDTAVGLGFFDARRVKA